MKKLLVFLFLCVSFTAVSQNLKKQTQKLPVPYSKEVYEVLKSDNKIKAGSYLKYFNNGSLAVKGQYEANQKTGIWEYYSLKGEVEQQYNWTTNKLESSKPMEGIKQYLVNENGVFVDKQPEELPLFLGGNTAMQRHLVHNIRYPADALRNGKQGEVLISAIITPAGEMTEEKIEKGLGYGMDEEAIRVYKLIIGEWIPGKVNGTPVATKIIMSFRFGLM